MSLDPIVLIACGSSVLAGAGVVLLTIERRVQVRNDRVTGVVRNYTPSTAVGPNLRRWNESNEPIKKPPAFLTVLGIRTDRPDLYPIPWWALVMIMAVATAIIEALGQFFLGDVVWPLFPVIWALLIKTIFRYFSAKRANILYGQLPEALSMIVRSVRVGLTVQDSLRVVAEECQWPTSLEFQRVADEVRVGSPLADALSRLAVRSELIEYKFFAVALALQSQSGGSLSETLENLADVVRKRVALKARAVALAAEAKMTMYVLTGLPFFTAGVLLVIKPEYLLVLVLTSMGKKLLFTGIVLLTLGIISMQVIIKKSVS